MKYYRWLTQCNADPNARQWYIDFPAWAMVEWHLCDGQPVTDWPPSLHAQYPPYGTPVDFPISSNHWHVHSQRLRDLIERELPGQIQNLPFHLTSSLGDEPMEGYYVANVLIVHDCLDRQRTDVRDDWRPVNPLGDFAVRNPVLSRKLIGPHRLFRIKGNSITLVIREDLRELLEALGITGCLFVEIEVGD